MTLRPEQRDELYGLIELLVEEQLDDAGNERLTGLLAASEEARGVYVTEMNLHAGMAWDCGMLVADEEGSREEVASGQWLVASDPPSAFRPPPSTIPPIIVDPSPTLHSPAGSFVFSHMAAAVILGIGLLIGLAWRISLPSSERQEPGGTGYASAAIGRITALADCRARQWSVASGQWSEITNHKLEIINHKFFLGDRFAIASGLMEITYDTGAKVILEGPCTYEIDSDRSGFLAIGRLTAKVDKRAEGGRRRVENADHRQLSTTHYQLFAVRTPTAVVTDLGTEFGVEVEPSGATRSHVFEGSVELVASGQWPVASDKHSRASTSPGALRSILVAGESARVERGRNRILTITRESDQAGRFVRRIPSSFIPHPSSLVKSPSSHTPRPSPLYRLTDLGTLGGRMSRANAINAGDQVVGDAINADGERHAFLYADGRMQDLGTLAGGVSCAHAVNTIGQVVGYSGDSQTDCRAFVYTTGTMKPLETLGGSKGCAFGINDAGQIVGSSQTSGGFDRAFVYSDAEGMKDLGALCGETTKSWAYSVNDAGQTVGYMKAGKEQTRAFIYHPRTGVTDLGTLQGHPLIAFRINNAGQVVGLFTRDGGPRAFLYDGGGTITDLGAFAGPSGFVLDINNTGQIVGSVQGKHHGALMVYSFLVVGGRMVDLAPLIDGAGDWSMLRASAINDAGRIVGHGRAPDGRTRAFMLTPVREGQGTRGEGRGNH